MMRRIAPVLCLLLVSCFLRQTSLDGAVDQQSKRAAIYEAGVKLYGDETHALCRMLARARERNDNDEMIWLADKGLQSPDDGVRQASRAVDSTVDGDRDAALQTFVNRCADYVRRREPRPS